MREGIKTSLISILCVAFASVANAAPTVRVVGGNGTYDSAASATAARAGSLRATGGFVRPTASVSGTTTNTVATPTTSATTTGGAVSTGGATVGRVASSPRLSIGKYIGAPKSVSTSGGTGSDLTGRVEQLETDVSALQTDKQDALQDSTYITIQGDELILDLERIKEDLEIGDGNDGREVEMGTNDDGLLWRYVGDTEWTTLITWDAISEKLDFDGIDETITERITDLRTEIMAELETKVDKDQGIDNAGRVLAIGADGMVTPSDNFYSKTEIDEQIENINNSIVTTDDLDTKLDKDQGIDNANKPLVVGADGIVVPSDIEFATTADLDNLGDLAYENTVSTPFIDNGAVERSKLATDITNTLDQVTAWENWWNENKPGEGDYVMSVTADGTRQWFRVITADESVSGGDTGGNTPDEP
ncbi:MAG: hypothetical protein IJQ90_00140 [Alphaproteobacteria bacterium]|nr:hypothetical protein [Alphaproteobacteria bacterium]